ncbi:MAG: preprotein translocase subunit SecE [Bacilli bacterium]|jgi:preprotein translocase subunit SecE
MEKIKAFFHGVKKEIERVRWPSRKNMIKDSVAVLSFCLFFCVFFYIINVVVVLVKDVLA